MTTVAELVALGAEAGKLLQAHGLTLAGAESCTGGLLGHILTETAGCSAWFVGSAVTYSNQAKLTVLQVDPATLERHGAVSAACAAEMAAGAQRLYNASLALAITGIAGPDGGSADKPVGLTFVALAGAGLTPVSERHVWSGDRSANKLDSARAALELLLRFL